jgi:aldehyde dehydrogenase (NAD+)
MNALDHLTRTAESTGATALANGNGHGLRAGRLLIDGKWRDGEGERFVVLHPADNEAVGSVACATAGEVDEAVRAARRAFDEGPWPRMAASGRRRLLLRIADAIDAHGEELTLLQTLENGVPLSFSSTSRLSGHFPAEIFEYHAGWVDKLGGETYPRYSHDVDLQFISELVPVGVVAAISPWNGPLMQMANKLAPALAAGCTVVAKPSEQASLAILRMIEIIQEIDLPPGVLNAVTGLGRPTGDSLIAHPGVDKVSFTGSKGVGSRVLEAAASTIKRVTLELGGKSAGIVFPDADLAHAASGIMGPLALGLSGQVCTSQTRALVHVSIYDAFVDAARRVAESVCFGSPFDLKTTSAALVNRGQLKRVLDYIAGAQADGAELACGGHQVIDDGLAAGNFVAPTIFTGVNNAMSVAREEIFGPVLVVIPFSSEEEAVAIANDSEYGLSGGVYTENASRALRVARALRTGSVGINGYTFVPNAPNGGLKASGLGREGGRPSIEAYTELRTIMLPTHLAAGGAA